jgi:hypothetical protein
MSGQRTLGSSSGSGYCLSVEHMVRHVVKLIRKHYRSDVPILLRLDGGFFDQKRFEVFEELKIGYVCVGKLYPDIKAFAAQAPAWGSTPLVRTLQRRLILSQEECHGKAKEVQQRVQARSGRPDPIRRARV